MEQPDQQRLARLAFERLVEEFADRVYNVALRITGNPADAEDAMQEAFLSAFRAWSDFRGDSNPTTWLYRIAVNASLQRVRARRPIESLTELEEENEELVDWSATVIELAERSELTDQLLAGLSTLDPDSRAAVVLRDIDGLSTAEAADALGISERALKSRLHRARAALRRFLADYLRRR